MMLTKCKIIKFPRFSGNSGHLVFIEGNSHIPFEIKRVYYIYDVPQEGHRGRHAHKNTQQIIIAACGSFDVILDDGRERKAFHLENPSYGLYITRMIWRELNNFTSGTVCLVLSSDYYRECDYIRDYDEFITEIEKEGRL